MIERYRDGVVPDGELDPALLDGADGLGGGRRARSAACSTTPS